MRVTIDACVWLAALSPTEPSSDSCSRLIAYVVRNGFEMHQPGLFIVELSATIARRTRNPNLALETSRVALAVPSLVLHELSHALAATAAHVVANCALRGADAVYVATARSSGATLVTLDHEVLERGESMAVIKTPSDWMSLQP